MADINLNLSASLFVPKFRPYLTDYSHRWEMYMGSAGSAKSYFITQKIILRLLRQRGRAAICRRYGTTLRLSVFSLCRDILRRWKMLPACHVNESEMRITLPSGSEIDFIGLDDEEKLLSLVEMSVIFIEEAFEVPRALIEQIDLRLRGGKDQQIILAWNPISKESYLYELWTNPPASSLCIHSTYKDNPFLDDAYIQALEELRQRNPAKARIFCDGEWGSDPEGLVFRNWREEDFDPAALPGKLEHRAGSDIGYIDPTSIIDSLYDAAAGRIYVFNEFYKTGCQLDEISDAITNMNIKCRLYMDAAEPRTIDYMRRKGHKAQPCIKGPNSVEARITFLQNNEIIVHPRCRNLIAELSNFSYEKDKRTGKYKEDSYTHEWSHAIDGLGYAYSDIYTKSRLRTIDKSVLGL